MSDKLESVEAFPSVLSNFTDDKLTAVKASATHLVQNDKDINRICSVLIASRRLYALARYALHRTLTEEGHDWNSGVEELLIKSMATKADVPFTRTEVMESVKGHIPSFMVDEVARELEEENTERLAEAAKLSDLRALKKISVAVYPNVQSFDVKTCLLLVGQKQNQVTDLVNSITVDYPAEVPEALTTLKEELKTKPVKVLRLAAVASNSLTAKPGDPVPLNKWASDVSSLKRFENLMDNYFGSNELDRPDVVFIDNICLAAISKITDEFSATALKDCCSVVARWAKKHGVPVIIGVITKEDVKPVLSDYVTLQLK